MSKTPHRPADDEPGVHEVPPTSSGSGIAASGSGLAALAEPVDAMALPSDSPGALVIEAKALPSDSPGSDGVPDPRHEASEPAIVSDAAPRHSARDRTPEGLSLVARGLEVRTPQGRVFGPVDWQVPAGAHGAVLGVQGSGRSAFLLALAGRLRGLTGHLMVGDLDGVTHPRLLRHRTAVARITDLVELEPHLTVADSIDEHALSEGIRQRQGRAVFADLEDATGRRFDRRRRVHDLTALERTLFVALLSCQRPAHHIVLDDVDDALTHAQLDEVYGTLQILGELGHYFVVSALESSAVPPGAAVVHLAPPETTESLQLSFGHLHPRLVAKES